MIFNLIIRYISTSSNWFVLLGSEVTFFYYFHSKIYISTFNYKRKVSYIRGFEKHLFVFIKSYSEFLSTFSIHVPFQEYVTKRFSINTHFITWVYHTSKIIVFPQVQIPETSGWSQKENCGTVVVHTNGLLKRSWCMCSYPRSIWKLHISLSFSMLHKSKSSKRNIIYIIVLKTRCAI